jgi:hypothetical protein
VSEYYTIWIWREKSKNRTLRIMPNMAGYITEWLEALTQRIDEAISKAKVRPDAELLEVLITSGLLPRYAFPVDVVALWRAESTPWNRGEEVQRDLQIGLSEFAPSAEIVIDGKIYESAGLYTPYTDEPTYEPTGWYYECPKCQSVRFTPSEPGLEKPDWTTCEVCAEPIHATDSIKGILEAIRPQGFCTDWTIKKPNRYRGGGRERAGYSSRAQLHPGENAEDAGKPKYDNRLWVHCREGELYVVNRGPEILPGFPICPRCGRVVTKPGPHKRPTGSWRSGPKQGSSCTAHPRKIDGGGKGERNQPFGIYPITVDISLRGKTLG